VWWRESFGDILLTESPGQRQNTGEEDYRADSDKAGT
jgi:hypothetical protein